MEKRNLIKDFMKENKISLDDLITFVKDEYKEYKEIEYGTNPIDVIKITPFKIRNLKDYLESYHMLIINKYLNDNNYDNFLFKDQYNYKEDDEDLDLDFVRVGIKKIIDKDYQGRITKVINKINNELNKCFYKINVNEYYYFDINKKEVKKIDYNDLIKILDLDLREKSILYFFKVFNPKYLKTYVYNVINEEDKPFLFKTKYKGGIIKYYLNLFHINNPLISLDDLKLIKNNNIIYNVKQLINNYLNELPEDKKYKKQVITISSLLNSYNNQYSEITKQDLINNIDIKQNPINGLYDVIKDKHSGSLCIQFKETIPINNNNTPPNILNNIKQLIKDIINEIPENKKHLKQTITIFNLLKKYNNLYQPITKQDLINIIDIKNNNNGLFDVIKDSRSGSLCFQFKINDINF